MRRCGRQEGCGREEDGDTAPPVGVRAGCSANSLMPAHLLAWSVIYGRFPAAAGPGIRAGFLPLSDGNGLVRAEEARVAAHVGERGG